MIRLTEIGKEFLLGEQRVHALRDINLRIDRGEYLSIMGPSGSGKSTLLNMIALLDRPSSGVYLLNERDVTGLGADSLARVRRENFGFVFQFFHLIPRLTAAENIEVPLILAGLEPRQRQARVKAVLESYSLVDRAGHRPDQLSGGQRQRVAIARATIMRPAVILADEPTGNLDQATGRQVIHLLEQLNQQGITLILVTHDAEIGGHATRRIKLVDGMITEDTGVTA
ncbi:MAG: macrolide ABC transporter ATP-binding protein [Gammaproteobacteria bacterium RIFCSPLOWO2_12_FULL_52_10]|nr:MAG: macrolide ABC transporter ATP-binding protein [Gammaproteobacteria bacterium RIFCSPLOWO2_12_FULL_52_10]